jgi:hypothetical protein
MILRAAAYFAMFAHMSPNGRFMASSSINESMRVRIWLLREFSRFFDAEGLRLMQAFFHITEPEHRREVIAFAENGKAVRAARACSRRCRRT